VKATLLESESNFSAGSSTARSYVLVGEAGEEAFAALSDFARAENLTAAQLTGVGAFSRATVGWFDRAAKGYRHIEIDQQCEVLSLIDDIADADAGPQVHAHVVPACPTARPAEATCSQATSGRPWRLSSTKHRPTYARPATPNSDWP
jgi:hypothetical protein